MRTVYDVVLTRRFVVWSVPGSTKDKFRGGGATSKSDHLDQARNQEVGVEASNLDHLKFLNFLSKNQMVF